MSVTIINTLFSTGALAYANRYANPGNCFNMIMTDMWYLLNVKQTLDFVVAAAIKCNQCDRPNNAVVLT